MSFTTTEFNIGSTFAIPGVGLDIVGYENGHKHQAFVPDLINEYQFRKSILMIVAAWWQMETNPLYLWGPMGTGKTSVLLQFAARMNIPVQLVSCHDRLETPDLVGRYILNDDGGMDFIDGPLVTAMRHGHLLILDEIDYLNPATAAGMNGLREGLPLTIPETGEVVRPVAGFKLAVTGNTCGNGDELNVYPGVNRLNQAFLDGFVGLEVGYPDESVEIEILKSVMGDIDESVLKAMVSVASSIRKLFMGNPENEGNESIEVTMSTRTLVRWARWRMISDDHDTPWEFAMGVALGWRVSPETKAVINGIIDREFA
jgi:cobaltochelatase CobS